MHDPFDVHLVDTSNDIAESLSVGQLHHMEADQHRQRGLIDCDSDELRVSRSSTTLRLFHHMEADQHRQRGLIDCDSDAGAVGVEELDHVAALAQSFDPGQIRRIHP